MAFLKWNNNDTFDEDVDYDMESLLSELEAASYIADKRSISKELIVWFIVELLDIGSGKGRSTKSVGGLPTDDSSHLIRIYK